MPAARAEEEKEEERGEEEVRRVGRAPLALCVRDASRLLTSGGAVSDDVRRVKNAEGEVGADGGGGDEEQQAEPAVEPCSGRSGVGRRRLCARTASTVEAL